MIRFLLRNKLERADVLRGRLHHSYILKWHEARTTTLTNSAYLFFCLHEKFAWVLVGKRLRDLGKLLSLVTTKLLRFSYTDNVRNNIEFPRV